MDAATVNEPRKNSTTVERRSDRELVLTRTFKGPARIVFDAWTKPELVTATFEEQAGRTRLVLHQLFPSKAALDGAVTSGMEGGMRVTMDQLDELVESLVDEEQADPHLGKRK